MCFASSIISRSELLSLRIGDPDPRRRAPPRNLPEPERNLQESPGSREPGDFDDSKVGALPELNSELISIRHPTNGSPFSFEDYESHLRSHLTSYI